MFSDFTWKKNSAPSFSTTLDMNKVCYYYKLQLFLSVEFVKISFLPRISQKLC